MSEKKIERYLTNEVKKLGGISYKFISPGNAGVPDRILIMPGGHVHFVELKTETGRLSKIQEAQHKKLFELGVIPWTLYGESDVKRFLSLLKLDLVDDEDE